MRVIKVKAYLFSELPASVQNSIVARERDEIVEMHISNSYNEAHETVTHFNRIFELREGARSWLDYRDYFDDNILALSGFRLQKYIWNNYKNKLFKGKYYSVKTKHPICHKRVKVTTYKNGNTLNAYHSAITLTNDYILTGVIYDDIILKPIYDFLDSRDIKSVTIIDLIDNCFASLKKYLEQEQDFYCSKSFIIEELSEYGMYYTIEGEKISANYLC